LPNAGWITKFYDTLGRLADSSLRSGTNVVLNQRQCQYSGHLRSKMTRTDGSCQDYTHDGGGTITALVASNQTLSATYKYDPYGRSVSTSCRMAAANTQRFSSKEIIPSTGFYYYGYRFYDPEHQLWLNRDPIQEEGGINLYGFAYNSPTIVIDPDGQAPFVIPVAVGGLRACLANPACATALRAAAARAAAAAIARWIWSPSPPAVCLPSHNSSQYRPGTKQKNAPPGTVPINVHPGTKDRVHPIKGGLRPKGAGPGSWVGVSPDGDIIVTNPDESAENLGPIENY